MRPCKDCSLCCKLIGVSEINKPENQWCSFAHAERWRGCTVYTTRPETCRAFECLWRLEVLPERLSPLRTKVVGVLTETKLGKTVLLFADIQAGARIHLFNLLIDTWIRQERPVIVVAGKKRRLLLPSSMESLARQLAKESGSGKFEEEVSAPVGGLAGSEAGGDLVPSTEEAGVLGGDAGLLPYVDE